MITKWFWSLRHPDDKYFFTWLHFDTDEGIAKKFPLCEKIKLLWSATDFPA